MSLHPRRRPARVLRRLGSQWHALVLLTVVWVLLWGDLSWANVIAGALIAVGVVTMFPLPAIDMQGTVRPWRTVVLAARFVSDLFVASFEVAWKAVRPGPTPHGAIVAVVAHDDGLAPAAVRPVGENGVHVGVAVHRRGGGALGVPVERAATASMDGHTYVDAVFPDGADRGRGESVVVGDDAEGGGSE